MKNSQSYIDEASIWRIIVFLFLLFYNFNKEKDLYDIIYSILEKIGNSI